MFEMKNRDVCVKNVLDQFKYLFKVMKSIIVLWVYTSLAIKNGFSFRFLSAILQTSSSLQKTFI